MSDSFRDLNGGARDGADLRDYPYVPRPAAVPATHMPWDSLLTPDVLASITRMQDDRSCVGHALAALIDLQSRLQGESSARRASAAMLYRMAHFYDESTDGQDNGIRSLRSAIKAFFHHGVCFDQDDADGDGWPDSGIAQKWPTPAQAKAAAGRILGAYSRLQPILHHYHCAIVEAGAILVTAATHSGWEKPDAQGVIACTSDSVDNDIHAFVIVGYNPTGFLILNSWGAGWGGVPRPGDGARAGGLAIWPYADWARTIMDGWVLRLGVPGADAFAVSAGQQGLARVLTPEEQRTIPYRRLRGHFVNLDEGQVQEHGPHATPQVAIDAMIARIKDNLSQPEWRGLVLSLPGVLEDEARGFAKAARLRDICADHGLEFVTCFWSASIAAEMRAVLADIFTRCRARAGGSDGLDKLFVNTARGAGRAFWRDIERHAHAAAIRCERDAWMWDADDICPATLGRWGDIVDQLARICVANGKPLQLLANGAGALVADNLLRRAQADTGSNDPRDWLPGLGRVVLTFPAVPMDRARKRILPLAEARPDAVEIIVPTPQLERRLTASGYGGSILKLVSRSFLDGAPDMLGGSWTNPPAYIREFPLDGGYSLDQQEMEDERAFEETVITAITTITPMQPIILKESAMDTAYIPKITLAELNEKIVAGTLTPEEADHYLIEEESAPFNPVLKVNTATVEIPATGTRSALALNSANWIARHLRRSEYDRRIASGYDGVVLTAEGDSWFQYPLKLADVIDYASKPYAVYDTSAAGDLLENMAKKKEYLAALKYSGGDILLLSAGGNDVCAGGNLANHLEDFDPGLTKPGDYLKPSYQQVQNKALTSYEKICREVNEHFPHVRIIVHGYDYVIPNNGRWLGKPMATCGITDPAMQRGIAAEMIDQFNRGLRRMANSMAHVHYVDCRDAVPVGEWHDELHPTDTGYARVAERILTRVKQITAPQTRSTDLAAPSVRSNPSAGNRAYSLHVGVNLIDRAHYDTEGKLEGCENDARAMRALAEGQGYDTRILLTRDATREAVIAEMHRAARDLRNGDQFMFTFAAHGARIRDLNGDEKVESNGDLDSTLCLYDAQFIDDEMWDIYSKFDQGVRILNVADTCHSGSLARGSMPESLLARLPKARSLDRSLIAQIEREHIDFYSKLVEDLPHVTGSILTSPVRTKIRASFIQFSACQDEQKAYDGLDNGAFTAALLRVWDEGRFEGSHRKISEKIAEEMAGSDQTPRLFLPNGEDQSFLSQRAFMARIRGGADDASASRHASPDHHAPQTDPLYLPDDEGDMPDDMSAKPRGDVAGVPDDIMDRFTDFLQPYGLTHFNASELMTLGGAHYGNGPGKGLNSAPTSDLWPNIIPTARALDELRSRLGVRVRITNAYRNPRYNKAVGGAARSSHLDFRACDVTADGVAPEKVADMLAQIRKEGVFIGGIGRYGTFTHVDTRGVNADWRKNPKKRGPSADDGRVTRLRGMADKMPSPRNMPSRSVDQLTTALAEAVGAVNGPAVIAMDQGLTADQRRAVVFSTRFAQMAADAAADKMSDRAGWWTTCSAALAAAGWTVGASITRSTTTKDISATVDRIVLELMASLPGSGTLKAIRAVLDSLRGMPANDEPLVLLDRQTLIGTGGAVQIGEASVTKQGLSLTTGAIQFDEIDNRSQILFAKWGKSSKGLWLAAEQMILNEDFYFSTAQKIVEERVGDPTALLKTF